jgi:hypothetical protein
MFESFLVSNLSSNISIWSKVVQKDEAIPKYCIERFVDFGCDTNQQPKCNGVVVEVRERVIFYLADDFGWINRPKNVQDVRDSNFEVTLE